MMKSKDNFAKPFNLPVKAGLLGMLLSALLMAVLLMMGSNSLIPTLDSMGKMLSNSNKPKMALETSTAVQPKITAVVEPIEVEVKPVDLNQIKELILSNRAFLKRAYTEKKSPDAVSEEVRNLTKRVSEDLADISALWKTYQASALSAEEKILANQFNTAYDKLVKQVIKPTVDLLQLNYLTQVINLSIRTQDLQSQVITDLDELIKAQSRAKLLALQAKVVPDLALTAPVIPTPKVEPVIAKSANEIGEVSTKENLPEQQVFIILVGMLLMIGFAGLVVRSLKNILGASPEELTNAAGHIASGQLDYKISLRSGDNSSALAAVKSIQTEWRQFILDTSILNAAMSDGKLLGRRNLDDYQGAFYEFAKDLNTTIDLALQKGQVSESTQRSLQQALDQALEQVNQIPVALKNHDLSIRISEDSELEEVAALCKTMNLLLAKMEALTVQARGHSEEIQKASKELIQNHVSLKNGIEEQAALIQSSSAKIQDLGEITKQNAENAKQARLLAISTSELATSLSNDLAQSGMPQEQLESITKVTERIASSNQYVADMSANITTASLDQSLNLYEANNTIAQVEKNAQKNIQSMSSTINSSEALLAQTNALAQSFNLFSISFKAPDQGTQPSLAPEAPINTQAPNKADESGSSKDPDWKLF